MFEDPLPYEPTYYVIAPLPLCAAARVISDYEGTTVSLSYL
jgi:hypothetical protein